MSTTKQNLDPVITAKRIFAALQTGWEEAARIYGNYIKAGGTQAGTQLTASNNFISVCATATDSVVLNP